MPGLTIHLSRKRIDAPRREKLRRAAALMLHQPRYSTQVLLESDLIDLRFTAYEQYPRWKSEDEDYLIFVEGAIYNKPRLQVQAELELLARSLSRGGKEPKSEIERWLLENDGEFIVVIFDKTSGALSVITDVMGRLPLFCQESPEGAFLAREPKYIIAAAENPRLDPIGIAEFLMRGHNMGERTMCADIRRLGPAALIEFQPKSGLVVRQYIHEWLVTAPIESTTRLRDHTEMTVTRFQEATHHRVQYFDRYHTALALSGGLDSRAVAGGLDHEETAYTAHTCLDHDHSNIKDLAMARRVAEALACPWKEYRLHEPTAADAMDIVKQQEGGSSAWMALAMQHYRLLMSDHGADTVLYTGDGGGNVMYPLRGPRSIQTLDDILRITFDTVYYWDLNTLERLLKVGPGNIRQAFRDVFASYPESEAGWKYGHHKLLGRPYRFIMEGEDRTRFHFWLGAPFWALPLVQGLLQVPEPYKANFRLFRAVLQRLNKKFGQIPYAATLINVPFRFLPAYAYGNGFIKSHPAIYRGLRSMLIRRKEPNFSLEGLDATLRRVIDKSPIVAEYFDVSRLREIYTAGLPRMNYYLLATVLLRIDLMDKPPQSS